MQKDAILKFSNLCNKKEREECGSPLSSLTLGIELDDEQGTMDMTNKPICSVGVPASCPRVTCFSKDYNDYVPCRRTLLIEGQMNESGYWMRLPCGTCEEQQQLSDVTKEYVYNGN